MVLLICPLVWTDESAATARRVASRLSAQGIRCLADIDLKPVLGRCGAEFLPGREAEEACDIIAAIGGDGTILRAAQRAVAADKPLFGINTGRVGFLSAFDGANIEDITAESIAALRESARIMLDLSLSRDSGRHYYALNDVVISKSSMANTIEVCVEYGRHLVGRIRADGVIVSTPTGSTAYSLSAGGPIVGPAVEAFLITPICPHSLSSRPFVLGSRDTVTITLTAGRDSNRGHIMVDGAAIGDAGSGSTLTIKTAEKNLRLLTSEKRSFYGILSREISEKD
jgi:NAD+ kinase